MITKKIIVKKEFRMDKRILEDLESLSLQTGKSHNELATLAFEKFIRDNKNCFLADVVAEHFVFNNDATKTATFCNITLKVEDNEYLQYVIENSKTNEKIIIEDIYNQEAATEAFEEILKEIDIEDEQIYILLDKRLEYK